MKALALAVIAGSLLAGCGFIERHFSKKSVDYQSSVQQRPLEVPPDLDQPNTAGALTIPTPGAAPSAVNDAGTPAAAPGEAPLTATPAAGQSGAIESAALSGDGLVVADTVESTWSRVGLALERSGAATVTARDEAGRSYDVQTTGQTTQRPGWFKRAITFGRASNKVTSQVKLRVRVVASGGGSKVAIEGANDEASQDAARSLLATLKQRLS